MVEVKICGITNFKDASSAVNAGADALGFNFYQKSPRFLEPDKAEEIVSKLNTKTKLIGVFVNEQIEEVLKIAGLTELDGIQLHGDENEDYLKRLRESSTVEIIKAFRVGADFDINDVFDSAATSVLLDTYSSNGYGGSGRKFDWQTAVDVKNMGKQLYLAGGLSADNIGDAIRAVRPFAVDACSLLESKPGKKDAKSVREFIRNAKAAI